MSADLTVPPPSMPGEEFDKVFGKHAGLNDHGEPYLRAYPDEFRDIGRDIEAARDAIWSERVASLQARLEAEQRTKADLLDALLWHFTRTPSTLKDSEARCKAHAAIAAATQEKPAAPDPESQA